eukprot:12247274-Alexandrium_andersonii.AAC.1
MITVSRTLPLFGEAQHLPRSSVKGYKPRCTRPAIYSEIVDTIPIDGCWGKNGLPWDEEYC